MRTSLKLIIGAILTFLLGLVVAVQAPWIYISIPICIAALVALEVWPTIQQFRARRSRRLLSNKTFASGFSEGEGVYWGTAPAHVELVGRESDQDQLSTCLMQNTRAIGVFGPPGVGKSILTANTARLLRGQFDNVLWHSLQTSPKIVDVLDRWLAAVEIAPLTNKIGERLDLIVSFAAKKHCLIILDNAETIFDPARVVPGDPEAILYRELLDRIISNLGRSTLIVTSTVLFEPFKLHSSNQHKVIELQGLQHAAIQDLFKANGVESTKEGCRLLETSYAGNPQALLILAEYVREAYSGKLADMLRVEKGLVNFEQFASLLDRQLSVLSKQEYLLVLLMAIWHEPMSLELIQNILTDHLAYPTPISAGELVTKLRTRNLIIDTAQGPTLSRFLQELVMNNLLTKIVVEMQLGNPKVLAECPLSQVGWPDRVRQNQYRFLLQPLLERISRAESLPFDQVRSYIRDAIRRCAPTSQHLQSYTIANLLLLLNASGDEFTDLDLSGVTIRGADFRSSWLHNTVLKRADVTRSAFAQRFGTLHAVALSHDEAGSMVAAGTSLGRVLIWNRFTGEVVKERQCHSEIVRALAFSRDGQYLYSGGEDSRLVEWNLLDDSTTVIEGAHASWVWRIALRSDESSLVSVGGDGQVRCWRTAPLRHQWTIAVNKSWIWGLACSDDYLVCGGEDGSVWTWAVGTSGGSPGQLTQPELIAKLDQPVKSIVASAIGTSFFYFGCADGQICRLNIQGKEWQAFGPHHRGAVRSLVSLPSHGLMASTGDDKTIRVWNEGDGKVLALLEGHTSRVWAMSAHSTLPIIVSAADDRTARQWRADGPTHPEVTLRGIEYSVRTLDILDGGWLVAASSDDIVRRWHLPSEIVEHVMVRRHVRLTGARVLGDSIVAAADDGTLSIRSPGTSIRTWVGHERAIECICVHQSLGLIGSGGEDRVARIWNKSGAMIRELSLHRNRIWCIAFSPSGRYIATGGGDHMVAIWNVADGELCGIHRLHKNLVLAMAWLDEDVLISGDSGGTVCHCRIPSPVSETLDVFLVENFDFVIRAIVCTSAPNAHIFLGGRTARSESGSRLVRIDTSARVLSALDDSLPGAIRSLAVDSRSGRIILAGDSLEIVELALNDGLKETRRWRIDGPYQGAQFTQTLGLSDGERAALQYLGAKLA